MPDQPRTWIRALVVASCGALLTSGVLLVGPSAAQQRDPQAERDALRSQRAEMASQVDALEADNAEVDQALRTLEENLRAEQAQLADAERAADEAVKRAFEAQAAADAKAEEVAALRERMADLAVDAYVNPPGHDMLDRLKAESATDAAEKEALLKARLSRANDLVDLLRVATRELEDEREAATQAKQDADERAALAEERLAELEVARAQQAQFASGVQDRLMAKLAEADALASIDAELSAQIMAEQEALAERLRAANPPPAEPTVPVPPGQDPPTGPPVTTPPPVTPPPPVPPVGAPPLRTVRGITVHTSIADQLEALLAAAQADGLTLGGSGYRDINQQIALRRAHCGTTDYAIYQMDPMLCTPPTAIPGMSMHEKGLAVDFTWNGRAITSRESPAFQWMAANAGRFGFINLPSEPWHWSVSGR